MSAKWQPFCLGLNVLRTIWWHACLTKRLMQLTYRSNVGIKVSRYISYYHMNVLIQCNISYHLYDTKHYPEPFNQPYQIMSGFCLTLFAPFSIEPLIFGTNNWLWCDVIIIMLKNWNVSINAILLTSMCTVDIELRDFSTSCQPYWMTSSDERRMIINHHNQWDFEWSKANLIINTVLADGLAPLPAGTSACTGMTKLGCLLGPDSI